MHNIFIYGTLKRGYPNHNQYLKNQKYIGRYRTVDCYPLVIANKWFAPVLIDEIGKGKHIIGELYQVDEEKLKELDRLEHTDHVLGYKRIEISIQNIECDIFSQAYTYAKNRKYVSDISSLYLSEYTDRKYIPMKMRKNLKKFKP